MTTISELQKKLDIIFNREKYNIQRGHDDSRKYILLNPTLHQLEEVWPRSMDDIAPDPTTFVLAYETFDLLLRTYETITYSESLVNYFFSSFFSKLKGLGGRKT